LSKDAPLFVQGAINTFRSSEPVERRNGVAAGHHPKPSQALGLATRRRWPDAPGVDAGRIMTAAPDADKVSSAAVGIAVAPPDDV
jgi:hypothetical protein